MQILGWNPRVWEEGARFFREHPVFEMEQLREVTEDSPPVRVIEGRCMRCGLSIHPTPDVWPADTLRAVRMTHAWDQQTRAFRCGGAVMFQTEPV